MTYSIAKYAMASCFAVLSLGTTAHADTSIYTNIRKQTRDDTALARDGGICDQRFGVVENGAKTSAAYKACMLKRGWRYDYTKREDAGYPDPDDPGLVCHDFEIGGVTGSSCSNF